jgi:hypothetical protein
MYAEKRVEWERQALLLCLDYGGGNHFFRIEGPINSATTSEPTPALTCIRIYGQQNMWMWMYVRVLFWQITVYFEISEQL